MISPTSNQKNVLKEYLEKALPHFSHFPICIQIITAYCTSFPTRIPYPLFKEAHRVFWELPPGKVGKNGTIVKQSSQKGPNCYFYAIKRLLRTEQTRTSHHALCSQRRKAITAANPSIENPFLSLSEQSFCETRHEANLTFLLKKGLDPVEVAHESERNLYKQTLPTISAGKITPEILEKLRRHFEPIATKSIPKFRFLHTARAIEGIMADGYGLQRVPCSDLLTIDSLIIALQKGPLVFSGYFGSTYYFHVEATELTERIGDKPLYGWKKDTPFSIANLEDTFHAIVVTGASKMKMRSYVYWIDPNDPNDPDQANSQKIYLQSFETFVSRMLSLIGVPLNRLSDSSKQQVPGALYNPQFTTV